MPIHRQRSTFLRRASRLAALAIVSLGFCASAFGQTALPVGGVAPFSVAAIDNAVRRTADINATWNGRARRGSPSYRRLGRWAVGPGVIVGAMLGAAVDCLMTKCGRGTPNIPAGVFPGMSVGGAIAVYAPRQVAAGFLGVGAGMYAGSGVGRAIQGDCSNDHPCRGAETGAAGGAAVGGFLGYRLAGP